MKVAIHQPEHFPYLGFFQKMKYADVFVILDDAQFSKGNWHNRNKFLNKNDTLNSLRIQITRGFQPQHLDFRFQETEDDKSVFEIEVSKHTGGMTNDDSMLYAKRNLEECVDFLIKCLDGYKITEEDKSKAKNNQTLNVVLVIVVIALFVWWIGSGIWW